MLLSSSSPVPTTQLVDKLLFVSHRSCIKFLLYYSICLQFPHLDSLPKTCPSLLAPHLPAQELEMGPHDNQVLDDGPLLDDEQQQPKRKLRVLCLHGFRTSGSIFEKQILRWDNRVRELLDLTFLDGPFPAGGKSDVEGIFPPPYYEWFQFNKAFTEIYNFEESRNFIQNFMEKHGPFDGLVGFSQGSILSAAFAGLQQKGLALTRHPPLRFIILVSGTAFRNEERNMECYSEPVKCPSVHIIGAHDHLKHANEELLPFFENPVVIRHEGKHIVPRLGEEAAVTIRDFLLNILSTPDTSPGQEKHEKVNHADELEEPSLIPA